MQDRVTSPTLHIVFDAGAAAELRMALNWVGRRDRVVAFCDDLSVGPIDPPDADMRGRWIAEALPHAFCLDQLDNEAFWRTALSHAGPRILWYCRRWARIHAGFLEVLWRWGDTACAVVDLDADIAAGHVPGASAWDAPLPSVGHLRLLSADAIVDQRLIEQARPLGRHEHAACCARWRHLRQENAPFRVVGPDLDLVSAPLSVFDQSLLSRITNRWQKAAKVVGQILDDFEDDGRFQTGDTVLSSRLQALADAGRIEAQGNLARLRHSEVRLAPDAALAVVDATAPLLAP